MIRLGITGTDTGVGKTVVTCAIAAALRRRGVEVVGMKPIETGVAFDDPRRDGARIARASQSPVPLDVTAPLVFDRPLAPLVAARLASSSINISALDASLSLAAEGAAALLVEGAGGLLVPLTSELTFAELFTRWRLSLVIVAANRLGVINHTMLTTRVAVAAGLDVVAVVLNDVAETPPDESARQNLELLRELLPQTPVIALPWLRDVDDLPTLAMRGEESGLIAAIAPGVARTHFKKRKP